MTPEQLDEIEKLAEAATPGPWAGTHSVEVADLWADGGAIPILRAWSDNNIAFIQAMREYALPLVKALREARSSLEWQAAMTKALSESQERLVNEVKEARAEVERLKESVANLDALYVSRTDALRESDAEVERLRDIVAVNDQRLADVWDTAKRVLKGEKP